MHFRKRYLLACLLIAACDKPTGDAANPPTISLQGAQYQGSYDASHETEAFLGVPFAQPPVGSGRWSAPQALEAGDADLRTATHFAPACMQGPHMLKWYQGVIKSFGGEPANFVAPEVSEDCLYLNIWRPHQPTKQKLPVYVYIHGGSNKGGWAYEPNYLGSALAGRGVIVVSIAYRLGVFGFFSHPQLSQANFALLDQIAALEWVQQNIAEVGGDPNNVTVAGESAGATNIAYLIGSPKARNLFQRAVHQSGGWAMHDAKTKATVDPLGVQFSRMLSDTPQASLNDLREAPAAEILRVSDQVYKGHYFDPVIDGDSVTQSLADAVKTNNLSPVDLIIGSNANEALMYLDPAKSLDDLIDEAELSAHGDALRAYLSARPANINAKDLFATSYNYACPSLELAQAVAKQGGRAWVYYFSRRRSGELGASMGAYHGIELPYIFDTHDDWLPTTATDRQLTQSVMDYWLAFMRNGDPNVKSQPRWPAYAKMDDSVLRISDSITTELHPAKELCALMPAPETR